MNNATQLTDVAVFFLLIMPFVVVAQTAWATRASAAADQPVLTLLAFIETSEPDWVITRLFAAQPARTTRRAQGRCRRNEFDRPEIIRESDQHLAGIPSRSDCAGRGQISNPRKISARDDAASTPQRFARCLQHAIESNARRCSSCWLARMKDCNLWLMSWGPTQFQQIA